MSIYNWVLADVPTCCCIKINYVNKINKNQLLRMKCLATSD